ncbi:hypothetical protein [Mammaliicoccus sciuri]|uniref:hypothetical protein n=1 Tax=Mammaliicoccus sciuri TaxID=1296 RepID=UPI0021CEFB13|nr:hypothetical protein [Mammaliicoccus sciuri]UXU70149.1 hypothetical protein MUA36_05570 [Mammaliicoccus sciuri]
MTKLKNEVNPKLYYELKKEIFEEEYYNTISGDWAINNKTLEEQMFNELSEKGQQLYSINHARKYVKEIMNCDLETFKEKTHYFELIDDEICNDDWHCELEKLTHKILNSKFKSEENIELSEEEFEEIHMISQDIATKKLSKEYKQMYKNYKKFVDENLGFFESYYLSDYQNLENLSKIESKIIVIM